MFQLIFGHRFQQFDSLSAVKTWDIIILKELPTQLRKSQRTKTETYPEYFDECFKFSFL